VSSALDRLHPVVVHHIVNTLGWRSLRALQEAAAGPVLDGADALLLAPTAGGKTEAAVFPLLTVMGTQGWSGISVIYVCPLKALLNNLLPRLETYAGWLGRRVALWHGDVTAPARQQILREPPDLLLTTPESLEAMLISLKVEHGRLFTDLQAIGCWPCACRNTGSAAGDGCRRGTGSFRLTAAPSPSCGTWSSRGSSTRTASCCSSALPPGSGSGTGTSSA